MKSYVYVAGLLLSVSAAAWGQKSGFDPGIRPETPESTAAEKVAEDVWFSHVEYLASDELKGRRTGTAEFIKAVEYVEKQFTAIGLKPAGKTGFRQEVGFRAVTIDAERSSFEVKGAAGEGKSLKPGADVTLLARYFPEVTVDAPLVFAGYGLRVPEIGVDDLTGVDLKGKIAVVFLGSPTAVHGPLKAYFRTPAARWKQIKAAGALGMIVIAEPRPVRAGGPGVRPVVQLSDPELDQLNGAKVVATVSSQAAGVLFAGAPHGMDELAALEKDGKAMPKFALPATVKVTTVTKEAERYESPNVAALLEGSDAKLKAEYVVLSAHLDHVGVGRAVNGDDIYNGAMDNAVGIASLIETAKALAAGPRPKRSILFLAYTGEEELELGSQYYAHYATVPRSQIVANLNMDMYLPLFPLHYLEVQGLGESTLGNDARAAAQLNDVEVQFDKQPDENRFIRSDQASFVKYGIPALAFKFGWLPLSPEEKTFEDWIKNNYHHANDDTKQTIDRAAAVRFDHVLLTLTRRVANAPGRPEWYPESFFSTIPRS